MNIPGTLPIQSGNRNAQDHVDWLQAVLDEIRLLQQFIVEHYAGVEGVAVDADADSLLVAATDPVSMTVVVAPGLAIIAGLPYRLAEEAELTVTAPVTNPRIDLVQAVQSEAGRTVSIVTGTEAASPSAPSPSENCIALAQIYCRPGMTSVKDADDSTNGYITDVRSTL